jgi:predicted RNA-binding Zn-ribbon protein involved in translation (DUF1610 family)
MAKVSSDKKSNFECPNCTAELLIVRIKLPKKRIERATCPHCIFVLEPRDGNDLLSYRLIEAPRATPRPAGQSPKRS